MNKPQKNEQRVHKSRGSVQMQEQRTRVVIVDDHQLVVEGLAAFLEQEPDLELLGTASSGPELFAGLESWPEPHVVVLDVRLREGEADGMAIANRLHAEYPMVNVLALSMHADGHYIKAMFEQGCKGYVLKDSSRHVFVEAVRQVAVGQEYLEGKVQRELLRHMAQKLDAHAQLPTLTKRERDILVHLMQGDSARMIAAHLGIKETTVATHRSNMIDKYGARNTTDLVRIAAENNLIND